MRRFFEAYGLLVPGLGFPAVTWLWALHWGSWAPALTYMACLAIFGYVVPGLGTQVTGLYEFRSGWRWGRMRPQQGFVLAAFGGALAWLGLQAGHWAWCGAAAALLVTVYDAFAIRAGYIIVYNKPHALGQGPWAIAMDYAPVFFFAYGSVTAAFARALDADRGADAAFFAEWLLALLGAPVLALALWSFCRHGYSGLWAYRRRADA